jgi:hypothetical protein
MNRELPPDLPVLTEVVDGDEPPLLTEVVAEEPPVPADMPASASADLAPAEAPPLLTPEQEAHLETMFIEHLLPRLEAAQREAVAQALAEFKQELPRLLREAQDNPPPAT